MPKKIAILTGGESAEREICLLSSQFVNQELSRFYETMVFDFPIDTLRFLATAKDYACAVPVFHGRGGEDGQIQGFLQTLKMPFLFSGVDGHVVGMNKVFSKLISHSLEISQPDFLIVDRGHKPKYKAKSVVKPYDNGSSVGVYIVNSQKELNSALKKVFAISKKAILEKYIEGKEYTVAVVEEAGQLVALPVIYIKPKDTFFNFESKYSDGGAEEICPAPINEALSKKLQAVALKVHEIYQLKHMSRSDFMVDEAGETYFLETNTIPGLTKNSLIPKAIKASGRDFGQLLKGWIEQTLKSRSE